MIECPRLLFPFVRAIIADATRNGGFPPLLLNPKPSWHKYSWLAEFVGNIGGYRNNTIETTRLAIAARAHLFSIAEREKIDFDL